MTAVLLPNRSAEEIAGRRTPAVDGEALAAARTIVGDVAAGGESAVRRYAAQYREVPDGLDLVVSRQRLEAARDSMDAHARDVLQRVADRIRRFAEAQRDAVRDLATAIPGGTAGHRVEAVERAGCYAPGGRYPLPSSVLMTAVTARAAGVASVWVASPRPTPVTLAAAAIAGADGLLAAGGAHAIAALAVGMGSVPRSDVVVGPGNVHVTAAKYVVSDRVRIDMLAGPSELVVVADQQADAARLAADLIAQAEHDPLAMPVLVTTAPGVADAVRGELEIQLRDLPTANVARAALEAGGCVAAADDDDVVRICDRLAPEHLQLSVADPDRVADRLRHYGALFLGEAAAEVLGDYGAGPNHTLPTGGTARFQSGLSVLNFLRLQTWMRIADPVEARDMVADAVWLAEQEGLTGHARAARHRSG